MTDLEYLQQRLIQLSGELPLVNETDPRRFILESYFGKEIGDFFPENHELKDKATPLLYGFYSRVFDPGLQKSVSIEINGEKQEENEPQYLLTRAAWIDQIKKKSDDNFQNLTGVLMLDVANLSGANAVSQENGDLLLLRVSRLLNQFLLELSEDIRSAFEFIPCRYGGDEFSVAVIKKPGQEKDIDLDKVLENIKNKINEENAYYSDGKLTTLKPIELKEKATKAINFSDMQGIDKEIFLWALKKGSVVDEEQIRVLKIVFNNDENRIRKYLRENQRKERDYSTKALFLMHDIAQKHPELVTPLYLANLLDQQNGDKNHTRLISVLGFVEDVLYDSLLGEMVQTFDDFKEHLKRGEFSQVFGVELKFVKELNDHFSMIVTDEMIKAFYKQLKGKISPEDIDKIQFFRRGGGFFIAVKNSSQLSDKTKEQLSGFSFFNIDDISERPANLNIPVGVYEWNDPDIEKLGEFMQEMDKKWYQMVREDPNLKEDIKNAIQSEIEIKLPEIDPNNPLESLNIDNLYRLFFGSEKRGLQRRKDFNEVNNKIKK